MTENLYIFKRWHSSGLRSPLSSVHGGSDPKLSEIQGKVESMNFGKGSPHGRGGDLWEGVLFARVQTHLPFKDAIDKGKLSTEFYHGEVRSLTNWEL